MKNNRGFTLIELLLVVVIIGLMLAVIVPRAWRANVDTKYGLVRQNCNELASFGMEWIDQQLLVQNEDSIAATGYYAETLCSGALLAGGANWVASTSTNWVGAIEVTGAGMQNNFSSTPLTNVEGIIAPERIPRNPFNGTSVFLPPNNPTVSQIVVPGAIALGAKPEATAGKNIYYAFCFQGTDSTTTSPLLATSFYAGQDTTTIAGLRNGVFFARLKW